MPLIHWGVAIQIGFVPSFMAFGPLAPRPDHRALRHLASFRGAERAGHGPAPTAFAVVVGGGMPRRGPAYARPR